MIHVSYLTDAPRNIKLRKSTTTTTLHPSNKQKLSRTSRPMLQDKITSQLPKISSTAMKIMKSRGNFEARRTVNFNISPSKSTLSMGVSGEESGGSITTTEEIPGGSLGSTSETPSGSLGHRQQALSTQEHKEVGINNLLHQEKNNGEFIIISLVYPISCDLT